MAACASDRWLALLSFHRGQQEQHVDTLWGKQISLDFTFFECAEMEGYLRKAGYVVQERRERGPYPGIEVETQYCSSSSGVRWATT
jgi:hypothetical protein